MEGLRACLVCDVEWEGPASCFSCLGPGVPGRLRDYCPHGKRRPYRGWPCPECRAATIETARLVVDLGLDTVNPGWAY